MEREYRICSKCVMDTTDPKITFDENGVCTHCRRFDKHYKQLMDSIGDKQVAFDKIIKNVTEEGKDKKYDAILGVSGGVDSSYLAYYLSTLKLRILCVHVDCGWNSELAQKNIEHIVKKCGHDLYTHILDWEEFKDIQKAFIKSSVVDLEIPTDHSVFSVLYKIADLKDIKYIMFATNSVSEFTMPFSWNYPKFDALNILAIHNKFGSMKMDTYPLLDPNKLYYYQHIKKIQFLYLLNYMYYNLNEAKKLLVEKLGWRDYGGKHYESIYTRFYQGYILPKKYNIDKRRAHLSNLIQSKQITREEGLSLLKENYYSEKMQKEDKKYVLKKLGYSEEEFQEIMNEKPKSHFDYPCGLLPRV
ncbi:MAG: hypothetical protein ACD_79C00287G0022 [uncultured bacterium]|nr:MAG: hypothetical protein ACD_79C00287G0022 [uncultured bacterium]